MIDIFGSNRVMPPAVLYVVAHLLIPSPASTQVDERIQLRLDVSQAEAVLMILSKRQAGESIHNSDWERIYDSEAYVRLKQREAEMHRAFSDQAFQRFVLSDDLQTRATDLRHTLTEWSSQDLQASARRVFAYLPPEARIRATVYVVVKPQANSFVYDVRGNPAIFLYLDPERPAAKFENTVAHELHHIGFASVSHPLDSTRTQLPDGVLRAIDWLAAFGEGFAMLAAAGGPNTHPHDVSTPDERARWERDMLDFNRDLRELEAFFLEVIDGRLATDEEVRQRGFAFFAIQGPWYTVGYRMAVIVERRYGRDTLIACMADPRQLLERYNAAAAEWDSQGSEPLALWSPVLLKYIGVGH
jgi:hypothetical protein